MSVVKDSDGKEYIIFNESELYDDNEMGKKIEDFEILQILGKGSYGFVAKIRSKKNKKIYAMKQINLEKVSSEKEKELCLQEITLLQQLNHSNVNRYYKTFNYNPYIYIIMEFMDNGDISGFINAHNKFKIPVREEEVWNILLQCLNALSYIHKRGVIHRDIKPANLYMTNDKTIKLGDFGVSAKINNFNQSIRENYSNGTVVGTPLYMSPEMINNRGYDNKTDVYSLGCTIHEICFYQLPRKAMPGPNNTISFINVPKKENSNYYSQQLINIINRMIELDPKKRPDSEQLCEMVKNEYIKTFLKTSSISSVVRCMYSLPKLTNIFFKNKNYICDNSVPKPISRGYLDIITNISNNINNKFNQFKEVLATEYPRLNSDDEIDPKFIVGLLLEKIHKELNKTQPMKNNQLQYIMTSAFNGQDEDQSNKNEMIQKFVSNFVQNFNSCISNLFFGISKEKKSCGNCKMFKYNFGCFCVLTFDINEFCRNPQQNNNITLENLFYAMHTKNVQYTIDDHIYCQRCLSYQMHTQIKQLYSMPNELIIAFERGVNCQNKTIINFPLMLDVSNYVEYQYSPRKFALVGTVNRCDVNGKEHYISFTKDLKSQNWICSDDEAITNVNPNITSTYGIPILLFYSSLAIN